VPGLRVHIGVAEPERRTKRGRERREAYTNSLSIRRDRNDLAEFNAAWFNVPGPTATFSACARAAFGGEGRDVSVTGGSARHVAGGDHFDLGKADALHAFEVTCDVLDQDPNGTRAHVPERNVCSRNGERPRQGHRGDS
jgi:hypothetical protein